MPFSLRILPLFFFFFLFFTNLAFSLPQIQSACQSTRNPDACSSILSQSNLLPPNPTPLQIIKSSLLLSSTYLTTAQSMVISLLASASGNPDLSSVARFCLEMLDYSRYRISQLNDTLPNGKIKNVRAWMSAAVTYQSDCSGGLSFQGGNTKPVNDTVAFLNSLVEISSYGLSMIVSYDIFGNRTEHWRPPRTERDGFWERPNSFRGRMRYRGKFPAKLTPNATVCKVGDGCYKTVQEAVNAAPNNEEGRFVIYIKEGVYVEIVRVPIEKKNVVFLGDGMGRSVISGSRTVGQPGMNTYDSATVGVVGDGFMAKGITFQNTAGAPTRQAVAFRSDSDFSFIENCEFIGNQDTLYAHTLRQYYKSCRIQGNVDYIFGNSAAVFHDCDMLISPRQENPENGETNVVTAQGRTDPAMSTGFVFQSCRINGTQEYMRLYNSKPSVHKNYLGRPWKEFSRVVYINCNFEALLTAEGWMPWNGDFALETLYYGEFKNFGPGSDLSLRVNWSSLIPPHHLSTYSLQNFIQGDDWIPKSC